MKKLIATLTILNLTVTSVFAQEKPGCFFIDENQTIETLMDVCPGAITPIPSRSTNNNTPTPAPENSNGKNPNTNKPENLSNSKFFSAPIKRRVSGIPVIEVKFNGSQTFEMLLDTGATMTTITPGMGQQLELTKSEQTIPVATAGGIIQVQLGKVNSLQAGNLQVDNVLVSVTPALPFGLLGQNVYGNYDLVIKANIVEFHPRN